MHFVRGTIEQAEQALYESLHTALAKHASVLWLVCGGSNIALQVGVMKRLVATDPGNLPKLTILPMDERYGKAGHADSNYRQMREAGFEPGTATWADILADSLPLEETVAAYADTIESAVAGADYIIGSFGMGADAHTAGVLPGSPAVTDTVSTVVGYSAPGFTRLTLTPTWLIKCNESFVVAYGDAKRQALQTLMDHTAHIEDAPVVLHYDIAISNIYNDQFGDAA